jgi:hypothetical protein
MGQSHKQGNASVERPTERLRLKLMRAQNPTNKTTNINNVSTPTQGGIQTHFSVNFPDFRPTNRWHYDLEAVRQNQFDEKGIILFLRSSPVLSEDDTGTEFDRYFEYLANKFKRDADKLNTAKIAIANQDLDLRGIHETDPNALVQYGMTYGLALKIKRYTKDFQLEQA